MREKQQSQGQRGQFISRMVAAIIIRSAVEFAIGCDLEAAVPPVAPFRRKCYM